MQEFDCKFRFYLDRFMFFVLFRFFIDNILSNCLVLIGFELLGTPTLNKEFIIIITIYCVQVEVLAVGVDFSNSLRLFSDCFSVSYT